MLDERQPPSGQSRTDETLRAPGPDEPRALKENRAAPQQDAAPSHSDEAVDEAKRPNILRRHPLWFVFGGIVLIALGGAGYFYWLTAIHPYESTDDAFVDARQFAVAPKVSGYVVDVAVTDNQHVGPGDVLFRIDPRDYRIALDQAHAQVAAAEASIRNIDAQVQAQRAQIDVAQAQVEQADAALEFANEDADRYRTLAQRGAGTVQQSQQSSSNLQQQQANLSRAKAGVVAAQKQIGALDAQRASAQASLAQAQAQRAQAELNLGYTTLKAEQAGRVVRLTGAKGQYAQAGQSLSMFVPDDIWVTANFKETQVSNMRPGQSVDIEIDAYPDRKITGRVDSVQPGSGTAFSLLPAENATGNYVKVTQRIPVKIGVENWPQDVAIGPGMSIVPTVRVR